MSEQPDAGAMLDASMAGLSASIDRANKRLDLTRAALKELIDNDFAYLHLLAAIDAEVNEDPPAADCGLHLDAARER